MFKVALTKNKVVKISFRPKSDLAPCITDLLKMEASETFHYSKGIANDPCC